jgi:hypothetical protein
MVTLPSSCYVVCSFKLCVRSGQRQRRSHATSFGQGDVVIVRRRGRQQPPGALDELAALTRPRRRGAQPEQVGGAGRNATAAAAGGRRAAAHRRRRRPARVDPLPVRVEGLGRPAEAAAGPLQVRHRLLLPQQSAQLLLLLRHQESRQVDIECEIAN